MKKTKTPVANAATPPNPAARQTNADFGRGVTLNALELQLHSILMARTNLMQSTLDGKHHINQDCGYPQEISTAQYAELYKREGISTRVVKLAPDESWKTDPEVLETQDPEIDTPFELEWQRLEKKFKIYSTLQRLDVLSGVGHFGILLIGVNDGKPLSQPVDGVKVVVDEEAEPSGQPANAPTFNRTNLPPANGAEPTPGDAAAARGKRRLLYLRPLSEEFVKVDTFDTDSNSPRYGQPVLYSVNFNQVLNQTGATIARSSASLPEQKVHWTRVIHVVDTKESDEVYGPPRLEDVFNRCFDLRKICGGSGEMFWRGGFPGINFKMDPVAKGTRPLTTTEEALLKEEVQNYMAGLQRFIATSGMSAESISPQVATPLEHFEMNLKAIAIAKGCPYRVFTGTEEGKLAGGQDLRAWNGRMNLRREKHLSPYLIEPLVDRLGQMDIILVPAVYTVTWQDLNTQTDAEKADNAQKLATALSVYVSSGSDTVIPPEQFMAHIMGLPDDVVEAMMLAVDDWVQSLEAKRTDDLATKDANQKLAAEATKASIAAGKKGGGAKAKPFGGGRPKFNQEVKVNRAAFFKD